MPKITVVVGLLLVLLGVGMYLGTGMESWTALIPAFFGVVLGLIILMSTLHLAPMFAAIYVFAAIGLTLLALQALTALREHGASGIRTLGATLLRFFDTFASMTAELTLLLATLSILTSAFVNTGVPPKVGFILVDAASINLAAMVVVGGMWGLVQHLPFGEAEAGEPASCHEEE